VSVVGGVAVTVVVGVVDDVGASLSFCVELACSDITTNGFDTYTYLSDKIESKS